MHSTFVSHNFKNLSSVYEEKERMLLNGRVQVSVSAKASVLGRPVEGLFA